MDRPDEILKNAHETSRIVLENYWRSRDNVVQPMREKWSEWFKTYRSYIDFRDDDIQSSFFVPLIFSHVESYLPRLVANRPHIEVWGRGQEDEERSAQQRVLLNYDWDILKMPYVLVNWVKASMIYGTGVIKTTWRKQVQKRRVRTVVQPSILPFAFGPGAPLPFFPQAPQTGYEEALKTIWDDPWAELMEIDEIYPAPEGKCEDSCRYIIHRAVVSFHELENARRDNEPLYNPKALKSLRKLMSEQHNARMANDRETLSEMRSRTFGPETTPPIDPNAQELHILEEWTDARVRVIVEEFPEIEPLRNELHELGMKPFVRFTPIPIPNEFYGIAVPEILFSLNLELNTLHNARMDTVLQNTYNMMSVIRGSGLNPKKLRWKPGGHFWVDDHEDIRFLQPPPLQPAVYRESENLRIWGQLASGATDPFQGIASSQTGGTATEAALLAQSATSRANLMFQILGIQALNRLGKLLVRLNEAHISQEKFASVSGQEFAESEYVRIDPDVLISGSGVDLDVIIDVAQTEPETRQFKLQRAVNAIAALNQIDPIRLSMDPVMQLFVADLMRGFGIERPENAIKALAQMGQQLMQLQAQMGGMAGGGGQGTTGAETMGQDLAADQAGSGRDGRMML